MYITIEINNWYKMQIVKVYASNSTSDDSEIEGFYKDIENANNKNFKIVMEDANVKMSQNM